MEVSNVPATTTSSVNFPYVRDRFHLPRSSRAPVYITNSMRLGEPHLRGPSAPDALEIHQGANHSRRRACRQRECRSGRLCRRRAGQRMGELVGFATLFSAVLQVSCVV
jgi:hypothetical protein